MSTWVVSVRETSLELSGKFTKFRGLPGRAAPSARSGYFLANVWRELFDESCKRETRNLSRSVMIKSSAISHLFCIEWFYGVLMRLIRLLTILINELLIATLTSKPAFVSFTDYIETQHTCRVVKSNGQLSFYIDNKKCYFEVNNLWKVIRFGKIAEWHKSKFRVTSNHWLRSTWSRLLDTKKKKKNIQNIKIVYLSTVRTVYLLES